MTVAMRSASASSIFTILRVATSSLMDVKWKVDGLAKVMLQALGISYKLHKQSRQCCTPNQAGPGGGRALHHSLGKDV